MTANVVLVAHHDERTRATAGDVLVAEGLRVDETADWPATLRHAAEIRPTILIVAAHLAGTDVLERLAEPREAGVLGVVVLTEDHDELALALDAGADDCVSEATIDRDLAPRVRALIRRIAPRALQKLNFGELVIDVTAREVYVRDARHRPHVARVRAPRLPGVPAAHGLHAGRAPGESVGRAAGRAERGDGHRARAPLAPQARG